MPLPPVERGALEGVECPRVWDFLGIAMQAAMSRVQVRRAIEVADAKVCEAVGDGGYLNEAEASVRLCENSLCHFTLPYNLPLIQRRYAG